MRNKRMILGGEHIPHLGEVRTFLYPPFVDDTSACSQDHVSLATDTKTQASALT